MNVLCGGAQIWIGREGVSQVQGPQAAKARPASRQGRIQIRVDCGGRKRRRTQPAAGADGCLLSATSSAASVRRATSAGPHSAEGGAHAAANGGEPCTIASCRTSQPEVAPGCTCRVVKGPRGPGPRAACQASRSVRDTH